METVMYLYAAILIAGLLGGFTGAWKVQDWRHGAEQNAQAREERAREETLKAAQQAAAEAIAKIEVKNVTINRKLETEVREKPVFRDCRSGSDSMRLFNSAIAGSEPAGGRELPAKDAAGR